MKKVKCAGFLCCAAAIASSAQTFKTVASFTGANGSNPEYVALVQGANGTYYGTTLGGGASDLGTVFQIMPGAVLTTLHSFNGADGGYPAGGLVFGDDGNLYGTTSYGNGAIFKITPSGTLTTFYSFSLIDGATPVGALIRASDGNFYGTTIYGGVYGFGTVFTITPDGTLTTLHSFNQTDGAQPFAGLIQARDGSFYGTTAYGGAKNLGTVFKISATGALTTLSSFGGANGATPFGALAVGADGSIYGTTQSGGAHNAGSVFKIAATGVTSLYSFNTSDGALPYAGLIRVGEDFYGTTYSGGAHGAGTVFKITLSGALTTLYSFGSTDGASPVGSLLQGADESLYGTTDFGGTSNLGTVFNLPPDFTIMYTISSPMLGPNLNGGPDCLMLNGVMATFIVTASSSLTPTSTTSNSATYTLPPGAIKAFLGTLNFTSTAPWTMKYTLASTANSLTLSGPDPAGTSFIVNANLVAKSFPRSVLGASGHPAPLNKADNPETLMSPASYVVYGCPGAPFANVPTKLGSSGTMSSNPADPPAEDADAAR